MFYIYKTAEDTCVYNVLPNYENEWYENIFGIIDSNYIIYRYRKFLVICEVGATSHLSRSILSCSHMC